MMTGWNAICQSAVSAKGCYNSLNFYLSRNPINKTKHGPRFCNITVVQIHKEILGQVVELGTTLRLKNNSTSTFYKKI